MVPTLLGGGQKTFGLRSAVLIRKQEPQESGRPDRDDENCRTRSNQLAQPVAYRSLEDEEDETDRRDQENVDAGPGDLDDQGTEGEWKSSPRNHSA